MSVDPARIEAITFDFGNTLVPVERHALAAVLRATAEVVVRPLGPFDVDAFLMAWAEERDRQFREEIPRFREVDLEQRAVRVLARLRGAPSPAPEATWQDADVARLSDPAEVRLIVDAYSTAFVRMIPAPAATRHVLERLAGRYRLGILSNWPLAVTIDRFAEAAGWCPSLGPIVVSQRIGTIKPHPAIFAAALEAVGSPEPARVLHVGDDWAADVVGAKSAGWLAAYVPAAGHDSPLPSSVRDATVVPDLEASSLEELAALLGA